MHYLQKSASFFELLRLYAQTSPPQTTFRRREGRISPAMPNRSPTALLNDTVIGHWTKPADQAKSRRKRSEACDGDGATGRTRTGDLLITNQLLYLLSHSSIWQSALTTTDILTRKCRFVNGKDEKTVLHLKRKRCFRRREPSVLPEDAALRKDCGGNPCAPGLPPRCVS